MGYYDEITDGAKLVAVHEREVRALEKKRVKLQEELARCLLTARKSKQERRAAVTQEFKEAVEEHGLRLREIFGAARVREKALSRALSKATREVRREMERRQRAAHAALLRDMMIIAAGGNPVPLELPELDVPIDQLYREVVAPVKAKYDIPELQGEFTKARRAIEKLLDDARGNFWLHQRDLRRHFGSRWEEMRRIPLLQQELREIDWEIDFRQGNLADRQKALNPQVALGSSAVKSTT